MIGLMPFNDWFVDCKNLFIMLINCNLCTSFQWPRISFSNETYKFSFPFILCMTKLHNVYESVIKYCIVKLNQWMEGHSGTHHGSSLCIINLYLFAYKFITHILSYRAFGKIKYLLQRPEAPISHSLPWTFFDML